MDRNGDSRKEPIPGSEGKQDPPFDRSIPGFTEQVLCIVIYILYSNVLNNTDTRLHKNDESTVKWYFTMNWCFCFFVR